MTMRKSIPTILLLVAVAAALSHQDSPAATQSQLTNVPEISGATAAQHLEARVEPQYPLMAEAAHVSGTVRLRLIVSSQGSVIEVLPLSGHPMLLQSAIDAVKQWRYKPFLIGARPRTVSTVVELSFADSVSQTKITSAIVEALVLAIQDEVYDFDYQRHYADVGHVHDATSTQVPLYIEPTLRNNEGTVIYKLMPQGEVYRKYFVQPGGMIVLSGDPELGFPPTQPSHSTLYMDDEELCHLKHEWRKAEVEIELQPSLKRIHEASARQEKRLGISQRQE
jgi:TonB family protein